MERIPKRGESLEQTAIHAKLHEGGKLAEDALDEGTVIPLKKVPTMPHPLGMEVMKVERHQRAGATV